MKGVEQITGRVASQLQRGSAPAMRGAQFDERKATAEVVNKIFDSLKAACPAWRRDMPTRDEEDKAKRTWTMALVEAGISNLDQVKLGTKKARQHEAPFFPSVGQFIKWCQPTPEDLGLPSTRDAYLEACNHSHAIYQHRWSHPAVYEAGRRTGWFELRSEEATRMQDVFGKIYADACKAVMAGAAFTVPEPNSNQLEHHTHGNRVKTQAEINAGRAALAALKGQF